MHFGRTITNADVLWYNLCPIFENTANYKCVSGLTCCDCIFVDYVSTAFEKIGSNVVGKFDDAYIYDISSNRIVSWR